MLYILRTVTNWGPPLYTALQEETVCRSSAKGYSILALVVASQARLVTMFVVQAPLLKGC